MATRKMPIISNAMICALYEQGESRGLIALRAKVPEPAIRAILVACGVRLRDKDETARLHAAKRAAWRQRT